MKPKVLWFTSYNKELYKFSGKNCLKSFKQHNVYGNLFTLSENAPGEFDLSTNIFLQKWLESNKDIIPYFMGGEARECNCPNGPYAKYHNKGCHFVGWNRQASRCFRKIACYHYVLNNLKDYDYYIWIDCDTQFTRQVTERTIIKLFGDNELLYLLGKKRRVDEVGFVGFKRAQAIIAFFNQIFDCYTSKAFRKLVRWDDGYVFWKVRRNSNFPMKDLASGAKTTNVFPQSDLRKFIVHNKGDHARNVGTIK